MVLGRGTVLNCSGRGIVWTFGLGGLDVWTWRFGRLDLGLDLDVWTWGSSSLLAGFMRSGTGWGMEIGDGIVSAGTVNVFKT